MKDLEQLEIKNKEKKNYVSTPIRKKNMTPINSANKPVNYEDKIK